jgi:hypothetical protein
VPLVRPRHTHPAALVAGSLHHPQHTEGPAREVRTGGRSSALRTESCASTSRPDTAARRSKREKSATPYQRQDNNPSAYWACAGQRQGRRRRARRTTRPPRRRLALRETGARSTPPNHAALDVFGIVRQWPLRRPRYRRHSPTRPGELVCVLRDRRLLLSTVATSSGHERRRKDGDHPADGRLDTAAVSRSAVRSL